MLQLLTGNQSGEDVKSVVAQLGLNPAASDEIGHVFYQ